MSIFTLPAGIGPDDWDEYETGAIDQRDRCEHEARVLAFGAIRRAAKVARDIEIKGLYWTAFGVRKDPDSVGRANEIRRAIRAAIGSDKS